MLDYCKGKFFDLKINTNATRLTEKLMHTIIESGVTDLVFSIDSYEKDEYESIRVLGIFEEVVNNIKKFKEINDIYPNSNCATRVSGVKINEKQNIEEFTKYWKSCSIKKRHLKKVPYKLIYFLFINLELFLLHLERNNSCPKDHHHLEWLPH